MKSFISIATLLFLFTSCGSNQESPTKENEVKTIIQDTLINTPPSYHSKIRNSETVAVGETYIDTLTFLSFDSNYDYWFGLFLTKQLDTVYMVSHDIIEEKNKGRKMVLQWEVDSLHEAGEGDELYYQERIIAYSVIRDLEVGFEGFLQQFVIDFVNPNTAMLQYLNIDLGYQSSTKIGLYCTLDKLESIDKHNWFQDFDKVIFEGTPDGHFCEGYPGIQNGFYYNKVLFDNLPKFDQLGGESFAEEKYDIPAKYLKNDLMEVIVINDEYHQVYLYFIQVEDKWYFFAQDLCDCSA